MLGDQRGANPKSASGTDQLPQDSPRRLATRSAVIGTMQAYYTRTLDLFRPATSLRWALWPLAVAAVAADLEIVQAYVPLPAAFSDITGALALGGYVGAKVLAGWFCVFLVVGALPHIVWRDDPALPSFVAAIVSATYFSLGDEPIAFSQFRDLSPLALVVVGHLWVRGKNRRVARWFYVFAPATMILLSFLGFGFLWAANFPFRQLAGKNPQIAIALLFVIGAVVAAPLLAGSPGRVSRFVAAVVVILLLAAHREPLLEENYPVRPYEPSVTQDLQPSHVILITIDTLRADALSYSDSGAPPTPNLDAIAAESVVFKNAISAAPWTFPAMNALMTGVGPLQESDGLTYQTPKLPTLAQFLRDRGYHTRAIVGNQLLYRPLNVATGLLRIDTFSDHPLGGTHDAARLESRLPFRFQHGGSTSELTDRAIEWAGNAVGRPSFLWLHYLDPHDEYAPPRRYLPEGVEEALNAGSSDVEPDLVRQAYEGEVRFVDDSIGRFVESLRRAGIYEDSLIVVTSDHGEEFWDHGGTWHGHSVYQELLHVPLLIHLPGGAIQREVTSYVPTKALLPTLLDVVGIKSPPLPGWSPSLAPFLTKDTPENDSYADPIVSGAVMTGELQWSVIHGDHKYIQRRQSGREEIYDLANDPDELHPLSPDEAPRVAAYGREILSEHDALSQSMLEAAGLTDARASEKFRGRLKSLGYIQ